MSDRLIFWWLISLSFTALTSAVKPDSYLWSGTTPLVLLISSSGVFVCMVIALWRWVKKEWGHS